MPCQHGKSTNVPEWMDVPFFLMVALIVTAAVVSVFFPQWLAKFPL